jgi:hypothetical protein
MNIKKSDELKEALLEQLRKSPILQIACEKLNIHRMSVYRWRKDDPEFDKAIEEALLDGQLLVNDLAESQLISAVKDRNMHAIMAWLKHHHPAYRTKVQIEGTVNTIQELSPEQKELVRRALELANVPLTEYGEEGSAQ